MIWCILWRKRAFANPRLVPPPASGTTTRPYGYRRITVTSCRPGDGWCLWETHDMDKFTTITVEQRDAIEILSLNRPDALNAVTPAMADELID
jgi:hypothetical protein